jgi:hypothetical protein
MGRPGDDAVCTSTFTPYNVHSPSMAKISPACGCVCVCVFVVLFVRGFISYLCEIKHKRKRSCVCVRVCVYMYMYSVYALV